MPPKSKGGQLEQAIASGRFVITAEVTPPVSCVEDDLLAKALPLRGLADAVNVTDGAGAKVHMSSLVAAHFLLEHGIEPIFQMTCRDRNRLALQGDLLGAAALGIRNILVLAGDDPKKGDQPDAKAVYDVDSRGLIAMAAALRQDRKLPSGTPIDGSFDIHIGAADIPADPAPGWSPKGLFAKAAAGADFVQTQFCMDTGIVRRYAGRLLELGFRLPLLIGVAPIPSARSARWMREKLFGTIVPDAIVERLEKASDPRGEGRRICVEVLRELARIPGVAGAHIMAPMNFGEIPAVIEEAKVT